MTFLNLYTFLERIAEDVIAYSTFKALVIQALFQENYLTGLGENFIQLHSIVTMKYRDVVYMTYLCDWWFTYAGVAVKCISSRVKVITKTGHLNFIPNALVPPTGGIEYRAIRCGSSLAVF